MKTITQGGLTYAVGEKEPIGEFVLRELARVYTEEKADEINRGIVDRIPMDTVKLWKLPIPFAGTVIRRIALGILDKHTPETVLVTARYLLSRVGLAYESPKTLEG